MKNSNEQLTTEL